MSHIKGMLTNAVFIEAFYEFCSQSKFSSESCGQAPNTSLIIIFLPSVSVRIKFSYGYEGFFWIISTSKCKKP